MKFNLPNPEGFLGQHLGKFFPILFALSSDSFLSFSGGLDFGSPNK